MKESFLINQIYTQARLDIMKAEIEAKPSGIFKI